MPKGNKPSLYSKSVAEVAEEMGISTTHVSRLEKRALNKIAMACNPEGIHYLAHEATQQEIDYIFKFLPWCKLLVFWDKTSLTKVDWQHDYTLRTRVYKVT